MLLRLLLHSLVVAAAAAQTTLSSSAPKLPRVLLVGTSEVDVTKSGQGVATTVGGVAIGTASGSQTISQHSEIWEVARHFLAECPTVAILTDTSSSYDYMIRLDYQKATGPLFTPMVLYQLVVMNPKQEPIFINRKDFLRREIKPVCKVISADWNKKQGQ